MSGHTQSSEVFRFTGYQFDPATGVAEFSYALDDAPLLTETLEFPHATWPSDPSRQAAFFRALELLYLIAGVSYYKAGLPDEIDTGELPVDDELAVFLQTLYEQGLGEFAHLNGLDLDGRIRFSPTGELQPVNDDMDLPERALVAMGGGKDSLVSLEMLRDAGLEVQPFCVGESPLIKDTVRSAGLPLIQVRRRLAPGLKALNDAGAWNGHVPVTAINSAIGVCASLLYGFRYVVFSNERSADEPTLTDAAGKTINHQYSKSWAFEKAFRRMVQRHVSPGIEYFSLLRPFAELAVAQRFSELDQYHGVFSSCNRNFHLDGSRIDGRWCGDCPKCRFTTLALAVFLDMESIVAIFGGNLLDQPDQVEGFRALCALGTDKPFECVGTAGESRSALATLADDPQWQDCAVVRDLAPSLAGLDVQPLEAWHSPERPHAIPGDLARAAGV